MDIWQRVSDIFGMLNSFHVKVGSQFEIYLSISSVKSYSHEVLTLKIAPNDGMISNPARYIWQFCQLTENIFWQIYLQKKLQND